MGFRSFAKARIALASRRPVSQERALLSPARVINKKHFPNPSIWKALFEFRGRDRFYPKLKVHLRSNFHDASRRYLEIFGCIRCRTGKKNEQLVLPERQAGVSGSLE